MMCAIAVAFGSPAPGYQPQRSLQAQQEPNSLVPRPVTEEPPSDSSSSDALLGTVAGLLIWVLVMAYIQLHGVWLLGSLVGAAELTFEVLVIVLTALTNPRQAARLVRDRDG